MQLISDVFALPIIEPLTSSRLQKIVLLTLTCLHSAEEVALAISFSAVVNAVGLKSSSHDHELEHMAEAIVERAVRILLFL